MMKEHNKLDDCWFPYDESPSMVTKIVCTIILMSMIFFMFYGLISFIFDVL